jgi:uncharacterized protein (DUF169 family)
MSLGPARTSLDALGLKNSPVAVGFLDTPPAGLRRVDRPDPAGCGYWKDASEGRAFYTTADDHQNCPVGAFTHGVTLAPDKAAELQSLVGTMIELKYLDSAEVPQIPRRSAAMKIAAYAPIDRATFTPDVVIFRGNVRQIMLLSEAARAAGAFDQASVMGRPACAMIPAAAAGTTSVASVGCIGNRVYTGLGDDEMYLTVPGRKVDAVIEHLETIMNANQALEAFHEQRARQFS